MVLSVLMESKGNYDVMFDQKLGEGVMGEFKAAGDMGYGGRLRVP